MIISLTIANAGAMMAPPLTPSAVGICTPSIGQKAAIIAAFLRSSFLHALTRVYSMVGCIGQPLRLAGSYAGSANPIQSTAQSFAPFDGGLSLLHRIQTMNTPSNGLKHAQNLTKTALFNVFLHRQCIRIGIAGALALRIKRRFPACVVKFSSLEVGHE